MSEISGYVAPGFEGVAKEFEKNFSDRGELGASVCVKVGGNSVVDLWGGKRDLQSDDAWQEKTLCPVFSTTKGSVALSAHLLMDRGRLDPQAPVATYWPEFAQNGKENITIQLILNHQSGVAAFRKPIKEGGFRDWDYMIKTIEGEAPFWEPGTRTGYHAFSIGWLIGELIRRTENITLGEFIKRELADPVGAEFHLGLSDHDAYDIATIYPYVPSPDAPLTEFVQTVLADPQSLPALALMNIGGWDTNDPVNRSAEVGGGGGLSNGRGLATLFAPFARDYGAPVSRDRLHAMELISSASSKDATLLAPIRFASGFIKSLDNRLANIGEGTSCIMGHRAFGHVGAGGSVGFADAECGMSFGYAMNGMGPGIALNDRGQSLIDAAYQALGYQSDQSGAWRR